MKATLPVLTVICPVYNEEIALPLFFERIQGVFSALEGQYETHLLFVDNCSQDRTPRIVDELRRAHPNVYSIELSRNYGYQCSIECGLTHAKGDYFLIIDVDCEDPPELIPRFLALAKEGYDIVYGERVDREEAWLLKSMRRLFYRVASGVADDYFVLDMAEFALITEEVRDAIVRENNSFPFVRASIGRVGFRRKNVPYKRSRRIGGVTHYNLWRMIVFGVAGILSSSTLLLRLPAYLCPLWIVGLVSCGAAAGLGLRWGLPALLVLGFGFCGLSLAFVSIYVARVYKNGLNRPNAIMRRDRTFLQSSVERRRECA